MTTRDKHTLLQLLNQYDSEELDCGGDCKECFYYVEQQNCPLLIAYDMIYDKVFRPDVWNERKG